MRSETPRTYHELPPYRPSILDLPAPSIEERAHAIADHIRELKRQNRELTRKKRANSAEINRYSDLVIQLYKQRDKEK
jgi:uncharacterized protein YigA (DUF484 family)